MPRRATSAGESRLAPPHSQRRRDGVAALKNRLAGGENDNEPESVKRYRQFLAGSTMPPDLRSAATGDIDSSILQTSTNRLLLQSWLPDGGSAHMLVQRSPAQGLAPQLPLSTPASFADDEATGRHRAGRGPSFALSPVLAAEGDDSMMGQSWLNLKAVDDSHQTTNWLRSAPVPEAAPETARSSASSNWLQAPERMSEQLEPQHSDASSSSSAPTAPSRARETRNRTTRPWNSGDGTENSRHMDALPPLPPLPPTPTSVTSKRSVSPQSVGPEPLMFGTKGNEHHEPSMFKAPRGLDLSGRTAVPKDKKIGSTSRSLTRRHAAPELSSAELQVHAQLAHGDEGRVRGSDTSTPVTPSDGPDEDYSHGVDSDVLRDSLHQALRPAIGSLMLAGKSHESQRSRRNKGANAKRRIKAETDKQPPRNGEISTHGDKHGANGHASSNYHQHAATQEGQVAPSTRHQEAADNLKLHGADDKMTGPPFLNLASHARETDIAYLGPPSLDDGENFQSPLRTTPKIDGFCLRSSESFSRLGLAIREHLNHAHFACGFVADKDRSTRQKLLYEIYFSGWKRGLVSCVVIVHSGLAFAELGISSYQNSRRADRVAEMVVWRAADSWIQALHFLCAIVYLVDATLMGLGLTPANLDPRRNSRNATFLLLALIVAVDTLLTAMKAETSSFSLPLRACLLVAQMPRAVHIFKMWAQAVWKLVMLFLGVLFGMVCLAALAVIGIRDLCQHRPCLPGAECQTTPPECEALLSHCSDFPTAFLILWNLAGGTGHVDNLIPLLDASVVFGMLYFVLSSAVCTVWFRFVWLAVTWHCMRDVSRRAALEERRQFILLLDGAFEGATQKNVPLCAVAQIVSCVWPSLTARQSLKALHQCFSNGNGPRIENVPREHLGALAWFLHADARVGVPLPSWMSCCFSRPDEHSNTGENAKQGKSLPLPLSYFMHFCAVLSFSTFIASAWLPDPGDRCNSYAEGVHIPSDIFRSRDTECAVNRGLEWLDVLICACFCVELGCIFMLQGRAAVARVCNVYRILEVTTEVLMILTLFRDQGMGNKAIILRLLRTPRLVFIIQSWSVFNYWLQFSMTTLVAAAQLFVASLVFIFFFGAVTWKAVVFSGARCAINLFSKVYIASSGAALDFSGLSSACYTVYLIIIGADWHVHTSAIFDAVDSNSQRFGFVLLFLAQWIWGQTLLYMFVGVILQSWQMCLNKCNALRSCGCSHPVRCKRARLNDPAQFASVWSSAMLSFGDHGLILDLKEVDDTLAENGSNLFLPYARIEACRVLDRFEAVCGMPTSCISMHVQDSVIMLENADDALAAMWAEDIRVLSRRARMEFVLDATVRPDDEDVFVDFVQEPSQLSTNRMTRCVWMRRQCTAFDVFTHDLDLPASLPASTISLTTESGPIPRTPPKSNPSSNGIFSRSDSNVSLRSSPKQPQQPASSGNEMSCRTNTTPKATPRKLSSHSPRHTPRDLRSQRELIDSASYSTDDDAAKEQMIAAIEMFKGLRPGDANALACKMRVQLARPAQKIILEGQFGLVMIRLLHGVATQFNKSVVVCTLDPGMMCGHHELFEDNSSENARMFVRADTECKYVVLTKAAVLDLLETRGSLLAKLKDNAVYLRTQTSWITNLDRRANDSDFSEGTERTVPASPHRAGNGSTTSENRKGRRKVSEAKQLGVTLLSNGPAPVYFSAEPNPKLKSNMTSDAKAPKLASNLDARATDSKPAALDAPLHTAAKGAGANGGPQSGGLPAGRASPQTPVVMRESEVAYLNNNVVVPPGASVRLASQLDALSPQREPLAHEERQALQLDASTDSWT